jgi:hypothetical protein
MPTKTKEITSEKQAKAALSKYRAKKLEIEAARIEAGIPELEAEAEVLKESVTNFMVEKEVERIEGDGFHSVLVQSMFDGRYIATSDDIRELKEIPTDRKLIPLRQILKSRFKGDDFKAMWNRVTKRVVDAEALEEVIAEGLMTVDEIAPAYVERAKKPYMRIFED